MVSPAVGDVGGVATGFQVPSDPVAKLERRLHGPFATSVDIRSPVRGREPVRGLCSSARSMMVRVNHA